MDLLAWTIARIGCAMRRLGGPENWMPGLISDNVCFGKKATMTTTRMMTEEKETHVGDRKAGPQKEHVRNMFITWAPVA